jgi:eukaryotic-like serine/threonine-protein kinase
MGGLLQTGQRLTTESSRTECDVLEFLGGGAQGEVYRAGFGGRQVALKWYLPQCATPRQRASLELLTRNGPPDARFLWPMELASSPSAPGFGYIMPLRAPCFRSISELMKRRIDPGFRVLATAGFELAHAFLQLHSQGFCYRDISFGNIFLDPHSGEIAICDNDNVAVDGDSAGDILGTPRFMAPEVVRGEALPSTQTDLFSLAVLLFYLFMVHHPLDGRRELAIHSFDLPAMTQLYGVEPLFIFDPEDRSNEPVAGRHDNAILSWPIYPRFLRQLFTQAFTVGLRNECARVREGEWRAAMIQLRDSILYCRLCGAENFYDGEPGVCWACNAPIRLPFRLRIGRSMIMLNHDTRLFPHHIDEKRSNDFSKPVAEITKHPDYAGVWGLKNISAEKWFSSAQGDPTPVEVPPGRTLRLEAGLRIHFGKLEGEVRI